MAEDEGFEPPQTESESGVLPLHKSSMSVPYARHGYYYTHFATNVKQFFPILKTFFPGSNSIPGKSFFMQSFFLLPGEGLTLQNLFFQIPEGFLFPLIPQHSQNVL